MPIEQLTRQLDWLASGKVKVMSPEKLIEAGDDIDALSLTFDDGFVNFGECAAPLLSDRGIDATVFVAPSHVGGVNRWDTANAAIPKLPLLSWDELRALKSAGFDVGGHGQTHRSLKALEQSALDLEITECALNIEANIGHFPEAFAFPYGDFDASSCAAVARKFRLACTTEMRILSQTDSAYVLPRIDMYYFREKSIGAMWGTPAFGAYVKVRASLRGIRAFASHYRSIIPGSST
ncbi:MAG: polysaccharide deacetylase family protein [Gemmatimonadales bacterium]